MTHTPTIAKPDDIDADLARQAFSGTSHVPEQRGQLRREEYAAEVNGFYAELWPLAKSDPQKERLAHDMEEYRQGLIRHMNAYLHAHSRCFSTMIAGPSNFPVRQQEKRGRWADNHLQNMMDWKAKVKAAIRQRLQDGRTPEEKAEEEWSFLKRDIDHSLESIMKIDEQGSPYTRMAFTNSISGKLERLALAGETELVTKAIVRLLNYCKEHEKPCFTARHKVWTFPDLARQSASRLTERAGAEPTVIGKAEGVEVVVNPGADRVQIVFAAKPSVEMIGALKREAWNWSRTEGAWQRKLTEAAKASAKRIVGIE